MTTMEMTTMEVTTVDAREAGVRPEPFRAPDRPGAEGPARHRHGRRWPVAGHSARYPARAGYAL
ncbi:hypothetical protein ACIBCA_01770 [Kitasatospora sp. NPDC051170]|uniref:hypothetical protein n=1 Tax=Kitasatospora sp. NPDC051170 TaxID=3364056 RepID=UPI00379D59E3